MEEMKTIYTMEQWQVDRTFKASAGQQITEEVYNNMLNCMPPKDLPQTKAEYALEALGIPVHAGFLMGEPHSSDKNGQLYLAFGMNDYGSGTKKEPKYFYLGLSHAVRPITDGFYYLFDCMGLLFNHRLTGLPDNVTRAETFNSDKEAIDYATDHEAELYKYEYKDGLRVSKKTLYEPQF